MSVKQSKVSEIRYMKRQHLEEEAKMVGNYYRDILRQYGIDCNYYKLKVPYLEQFKTTLDENQLLLHAYGEDSNPDYSISADMVTYMEVEQDIIQLQKYGAMPNMDVNFYFDTRDFACELAWKMGQLREYPIKEQTFLMDVPAVISDYVEYEVNGQTKRSYLSDDIFPYGIGYGVPTKYESDILSGRFAAKLDPYELDKEYTVMCHPYEHGDVNLKFPVNDTIYKSFLHSFGTHEFVDQVLFLTYHVSRVDDGRRERFVLHGRLHGAVLFHDLTKVGKYLDMIHPDVGDIVTIDFPDETNRQQFEITDCNDKNLASDGINPLLHRYVWKCKARRYINSGEQFPEINESNERWNEGIDFLNNSDEIIARQIGQYDENANDAVYGGYERKYETHDKGAAEKDYRPDGHAYEFVDDGSLILIHEFGDGSRLGTDGYDLVFVDSRKNGHKITCTEPEKPIQENYVQTGLQYIKSTDNALYFVNFDNVSQKICEDDSMTQDEVEYCLNSLVDTTYNRRDNNTSGDFYYKFRESNTVLMSLNDHLYCRLGNRNRKMFKLC